LFSGILQQGYAFGYLLAAVVYWIVFPFFGWRGLFVAGALPAVLVLYIRARVPESPVWLRQQHAMADFWSQLLIVLKRHWALFLYVVLLMTAFNAMSHGTQDMYQTFLGEQRHYGVTQKAATGIIYAFGAICGGTIVGHLSQKWGRRRSIILCAALGIVLIPLWTLSPGYALLVIGGFAMQFMVQGAWGIVPVHLNELSPDAVRGTFPGFAYQLGNLFAANTAVVEAQLANHFRDVNGNPGYAKNAGRNSSMTNFTVSRPARGCWVPPADVIVQQAEAERDKLRTRNALRRLLRQFYRRVTRDTPSPAPGCLQSDCSDSHIPPVPPDSSQAGVRENLRCELRRLPSSGSS
jgi:MFS family permease